MPSDLGIAGADGTAVADTMASDGGAFASSVLGARVSDGGAFVGSVLGARVSDGGAFAGSKFDTLDSSLSLVRTVSTTAPGDLALAGFRDAADFAGQVEELSRTVEYLQLLAAGAVDRTRKETANAAPAGWTTGWGYEAEPRGPAGWDTGPMAEHAGSAGTSGAAPAPASASVPASASMSESRAGNSSGVARQPNPADDGCRNTAEFLRIRLRISIAEARRRLALAASVLPRTGIAGQPRPAEREELAAAIADASVSSRAGTIIILALDKVRHLADPDTASAMEHNLTTTAINNDPDFLSRIAKTWTDFIDANGAEPSEEELRQRQGAFIRHPRRGLHHLEIFATQHQFEHLLTVMNTATNPRTRTDADAGADQDTDAAAEAGADAGTDAGAGAGAFLPACDVDLDRRTRPQKLLDGLITACKAGLTTGKLPTAGGFRPQVMVTISYQDLLARLQHKADQGRSNAGTGFGFGSTASTSEAKAGTDAASTPTGMGMGGGTGTGTFTFTGPITASTVRQIACDADIIPVLLGSEGRVLDIGRATRIFPPHIRKAITARDKGCAFPNCTMPAPWTEAHHITYWSHGGNTSTDNGTLLCTTHHHLIHKEQWTIQIQNGIPWFIPPPHLDPHQKPQRNRSLRT